MINNLRKWSRQLAWTQTLRFPNVAVALEGCGSGFNATNSIRTCLHFGSNPPLFIGKSSFKDIQSLSVDNEEIAKKIIHCVETLDEAREYDKWQEQEEKSTVKKKNNNRKIIAIENFVPGCLAVDGTDVIVGQQKEELVYSPFQFPEDSLIVMGHENKGVSKETLEKADAVVYIPQFGTISSVNVVSCMGLMLFHYCRLFNNHNNNTNNSSNNNKKAEELTVIMRRQIAQRVDSYQNYFREKLPMTQEGTRVDPRPIHPSFFHKESDQIRDSIQQQMNITKTFRVGKDDVAIEENMIPNNQDDVICNLTQKFITQRREFPSHENSLELSVFFENFADQRNLGGLVRNSNAFLASVLYAGRRRINKQGTVGSDHYTNIKFLGPMKDSQLLHNHKTAASSSSMKIEYDISTIDAIENLSQEDDAVWWLLDCNQEKLFENVNEENNNNNITSTTTTTEMKLYNSIVKHLPEIPLEQSDKVYEEVLKIRVSSCEGNEPQKQPRKRRLILVVPPEAGLPCEYILNKCSARVTIFGRTSGDQENESSRGLPSQIASAIALHQLSPLCLF